MKKMLIVSEIKTLFENIEPYSTGYLEIDGHEIYYEECGNPTEARCFSSWRTRWWR